MQQVAGPEVVRAQVAIEAMRLSPTGGELVFVRRTVNRDAYRSHIWGVPWRGGRPRQLTHGAVRDASPCFSPDGRQLAFVRAADGADGGQVWVLPLEGGEAWQLTSMEHGVADVVWSPDARRLALTGPGDKLRLIEGRSEPGGEPTARRMTRLDWRDDEETHRDRFQQLFTIAVRPGARPRRVTSGDFDVSHPAWAPDSRSIFFAADPRPEADTHPRPSIWQVSANGGGAREVASLGGPADYPSISPDGRLLAFAGTDRNDPPEYEPWLFWLIELGRDGRVPDGARPRHLAVPDNGMPGGWAWSDLDICEEMSGPAWQQDGESVACLIALNGRTTPWRLPLDGSPAEQLTSTDRMAATALDAQSGRIAVCAAIDGRAGTLYALEDGGSLRPLTNDRAANWQRRYRQPVIDELAIDGPGGPINTWVASPPGAEGRATPTLIHFHGGPTGAVGSAGTLDAMVMTGAGYRVVMPNLRGSATFGYDWAHALNGRWGEVDAEDALAVLDGLIERGLTDPARVGLMGYSYGGFLINWMLGVSDRFAAAVSENSVTNQISTWANSWFGVEYNRQYGLGNPLTEAGMLQLWRSSPLANVANIRTPLLLLQAEEDHICPPADSEQLFTALRVLGREVEYVLYPEEHHEMKNYGRPDRRMDRLRRHLDWFGRFMPPD